MLFRSVDAVSGRPTGNRGGRASVDAELKVQDRSVDTGGNKGIPIGLDDAGEALFVGHG